MNFVQQINQLANVRTIIMYQNYKQSLINGYTFNIMNQFITVHAGVVCVVGNVQATNYNITGFKEGIGFALGKC